MGHHDRTRDPREEGQTMAEYALILGLVMLAALVAFQLRR